ncbi:hypothetical protein AG0111_0g944 [Alternaria gaisen]|uniref:Uncharacterized protein n=1 Tax=Alternaria gaisen TaxID=167740 RepID=A0ACB6FZ15_9PLEO|nr:hypothetical protein AG0111_0g944 [Alternaria gaisen]
MSGQARSASRRSGLKENIAVDDDYSPPKDSSAELSELDSDTFSPEEIDQVDIPHKRQLKQKAPTRKSGRKKSRLPGSRDDAPTAVTKISASATDLQTLRIVPSSKTRNVNKWLEAFPTLSVLERVTASPPSLLKTDLTPLGDLPDMIGRQFKYDVELVELDINWDPVESEEKKPYFLKQQDQMTMLAKYRKKMKTWRVFVWDDALPKDQQTKLRLFPEHAPQSTRQEQAWIKKEALWKSQKRDMSALPPLVFPYKNAIIGGPLDINVCPDEATASRVAAEACRLLNKYPLEIDSVDFPQQTGAKGEPKSSGMRTLIELMAMRKIKDDFDFRSLRYIFHSTAQESGYYCLSPQVSISKALGAGSRYYVVLPTFTTEDIDINKRKWTRLAINDDVVSEKGIDSLPEVPSWWGMKYVEPDTKDAFKKLVPVDKMLKFINYLSWSVFGHLGTRDGILSAPRALFESSTSRSYSMAGPYNGKPLFKVWKRGPFRPSHSVASTISGKIPQAQTSLPTHVAALALQSAYHVFCRNEGILKTFQELFVALDELALKKSILSKHSYCVCGSDAKKKADTAHFCMFCLRLKVCSEMAWTIDDRLVCLEHFKNGPPAQDNFLVRRIRIKVDNLEHYSRVGISSADRRDMKNTLIKDHVLSNNHWRDIFNGDRVDDQAEYWLAHSVDAIYPLWMSDNLFHVHHPGNVGLTNLFTNLFKNTDLPIMLAAASNAVRTQVKGEYLPEIELAFDHFARIRTVIPWKIDSRRDLVIKQPKRWWLSYYSMMRSGVFDGRAPLKPVSQVTYGLESKPTTPWTDTAITGRLNRICREIENDSSINPNGLKLLRSKKTGAPWLWNPEHMFDNHNWEYLGRLFEFRMYTMDNLCDWTSNHDEESNETLFLACVVLWFMLDGGKDEVLGLRMTVFKHHALRFSIGRALHVLPGSIMRTGWKVKYPKSISQYDDAQRTITMESWAMNRGKSNFPTDHATVASWTDVIRHWPQDSKFWDAYPPNCDLKPVNWPRDWKAHRFPTGPHDRDMDDDDDLEDEEESDSDIDNYNLVEEEELIDVGDDEEIDSADGDDEETDNADENTGSAQIQPMTHTDLEEDQEFLSSLAKHLPNDVLQRYQDTISKWGKNISVGLHEESGDPGSGLGDEPGSDTKERLELFKFACAQLIHQGVHSEFAIKGMSTIPLEVWQRMSVETTFTEDEITSFCLHLHDKGNLIYYEKEAAFTYKI